MSRKRRRTKRKKQRRKGGGRHNNQPDREVFREGVRGRRDVRSSGLR